MPASKLKNLAILILLLANAALLAILLPGRLAERREAQQLRQSLSDLYAAQNVALDPGLIPDAATLYVLELGEDRTAEQAAAAALLGEGVTADQDSTRYLSVYNNEKGSCSISRSGQFQARLKDQPETTDLSAAAKKTLKAMGFSWGSLTAPNRLRAGVYALEASQNVLGVPVFEAQLTLVYANSRLTDLDGVYFPGGSAHLTRVSDRSCMTAADALVHFLSARYELGWVGSQVTCLRQGYLRSETASAAGLHLTPVWLLETDTGSFYVDGISGQITPISP